MSFVSVLLAGCATPPIETIHSYCDLTEDRRFTQAEFDWRVENAAKNLRLDIEQNELRAELCE